MGFSEVGHEYTLRQQPGDEMLYLWESYILYIFLLQKKVIASNEHIAYQVLLRPRMLYVLYMTERIRE